jgi:hypothetical protein
MYPNNDGCPPCPDPIVPIPIPDHSHTLCNMIYDGDCTIYTGPNVDCVGIKTGMTFNVVSALLSNALINKCKINSNCVLSDWGPWEGCEFGRTETRCRTILTPGCGTGIPCPEELCETRPCTNQLVSMCFSFGYYLCETQPQETTQVYETAAGFYNDYVYYEFDVCGNHYVIWFDTTDNLWHLSNELGVKGLCDFTLDNNGNDHPITNGTTELWHNPSNSCNLFLFDSSLQQENGDDCPVINMCFNLQLTFDGIVYNFQSGSTPAIVPFDSNDKPLYNFTVVTAGTSHNIFVGYDPIMMHWFAQDNGQDIGTLVSSSIYPYGVWTPDPGNPTSYMISSSLGGECIQPPDVDCVLNCGPWSACVGGTQTRTCTVAVPPSGNGTPCGPLVQTQVCSTPSCFPPTSVVPSIAVGNANVVISFIGVTGATNYTVNYTIDGGVTFTNVVGTSSPISLPYVCGKTYSGTVKTLCSNGIISSTVPFTINTNPCAPPSCAPVTDITFEESYPDDLVVNFTEPPGAISYDLFWQINDGGMAYNTGTSSPILLPYMCGVRFSGFIRAHCSNGLTSDSLPYVYYTSDCIQCEGELERPMIGGYGITSPAGNTISLSSIAGYDTSYTPAWVFGGGTAIYDILPTPFGYVYSGYFTTMSSTSVPTIFGLNSIIMIDCLGVPNNSFFGSGFKNASNQKAYVTKVVYHQGTNRIYAVGDFVSYKGVPCTPGIVALDAITGNIDPTFNGSLVGAVNSLGNMVVSTIHVQDDGAVLVGGQFTSMYGNSACKYLCRFTSMGVIDTSFSVGSSFTYSTQSLTNIQSIKTIRNSTGSIYVGGTFNAYQGTTRYNLLKLLPNGNLDTAFDPGILTFNTGGGCSSIPTVFDIQDQGNKLLIGGSFVTYAGTTVDGFTRIDPVTAIRDSSFTINTSTGTCKYVRKIVVKNNRIYIGSSYTQFGGSTKSFYYVLESDGTVAFTTSVTLTGSAAAISAIYIP